MGYSDSVRPGRTACYLLFMLTRAPRMTSSHAAGHFNLEHDGYKYGAQVKQADTIMAFGYPLSEWRDALAPSDVDPVAVKNDLTYYEGVTNPGGPVNFTKTSLMDCLAPLHLYKLNFIFGFHREAARGHWWIVEVKRGEAIHQ